MSNYPNELQSRTELAEVGYHFRKKDGYKRPSVTVNVPVPTASAVIAFLQDDSTANQKVHATIMEAVRSIVTSYVRSKVDADENFNQESLDAIAEEVSLVKIANLPRSERSTITKDDLLAFGKVYAMLMPEMSGCTQQAAENVATIFAERLRPALGNNPVLEKLQARLQEFVEKAPEEVTGEHSSAIEYLLGRIDEALGINYDPNAL